MKILHITPHLGGGVGTVIMDWMEKIEFRDHRVICLDYANEKALKRFPLESMIDKLGKKSGLPAICFAIAQADIVLVHYWDHKMLADLFTDSIPDCRLVFWCHKYFDVPFRDLNYPDRFIGTSPIQNHYKYIWSTGNMDRFLAIEPKPHQGFNIGYVGTVTHKKIHANVLRMCHEIIKVIPDARFTFVGDCGSEWKGTDKIRFTGPVDDVAPYLAEMDVFGYPLRPDHYGTCEIALGECMAAGVVPVVLDNPAEKSIWYWTISEDRYCEQVVWYYRNPDNRMNITGEARKRAKELYSIDTMIQQWDEVFNEMIQKPKTRKEAL